MKTVILIALLLAGIVPAGGFAQTPNGRAGTLDLRATSQAMHDDSVPTGCQLSFNWGNAYMQAGKYAQSYDTLALFIQNCSSNQSVPNAFEDMATDVQNGAIGPFPDCLVTFRQWLISALAWNPHNPVYFCTDVQTIEGTFGTNDTSWTKTNAVTNMGLAVIRWLIQNPLCASIVGYDSLFYGRGRGSQRETWINSQDTSKVKLDTTLPSMHDLGLDSVLKYAAMLGVHDGVTSILSNTSAYPNPTGEGTVISFGTSKEAYVHVELFDALGHTMGRVPFESVIEPGNHEVPISLHDLPNSTYYARIQTTYSEVQTVKLVKE